MSWNKPTASERKNRTINNKMKMDKMKANGLQCNFCGRFVKVIGEHYMDRQFHIECSKCGRMITQR